MANSRRQKVRPTTEREFSLMDQRGTVLRMAREDHTHGTPANPIGTILDSLLGTDHQILITDNGDDTVTVSFESPTRFGSSSDYVEIGQTGIVTLNGASHVNWQKHTANGVTVSDGTPTGNVSDLQTKSDGNVFEVAEVSGTPGFNIVIDFSSVDAFNWVSLKGVYVGGNTTHAATVGVYDYANAVYVVFGAMHPAGVDITKDYSFFVPNSDDFISGAGVVKIRIRHAMAGIASHYIYLDEVALYQ